MGISVADPGFPQGRANPGRCAPTYYYRPQTKLREGYVFTGVCDSVHGGGGAPCWGVSLAGGSPCQGGLLARGVSLPGGLLARGSPWQGGGVPCDLSHHAFDVTCQCAGGTHPTGMHSCLAKIFATNCTKMKNKVAERVPRAPWLHYHAYLDK